MTDTDDIEREFVGLDSPVLGRAGAGGHPCQGLYHHPRGRRPRTAFIATHYNIDFSEHYLADHMAARGFGFLGWNTRFRGNEQHFLLDHALAEIGVGVRWLRERAGVENVVILGNSGGGSLMGAYQSQATEPNVMPTHDHHPVPGIEDLIPGDLFVFLAAHPGRPEILTNWMDPSVTDETDPLSVDPELDMYLPGRPVPFPPEFVAEYRRAQRDRNERITVWVHSELVRLREHGVHDRLFVVPRLWADLRFVDPTIDPNGRTVPGCYLGDPRRANYGVYGVGLVNTLRTWLSMWSLDESQCQAGPHLARIHIPTLLINASDDSAVFPSDAEAIIAGVAADDKTAITIEGDHYFRERPGARDEVADAIAAWVEERIPNP